MKEHHGKDFFIGAMIGSTLGALTAAMFTTKKGDKIRQKLQLQFMDKYHEFEEMIKHYAISKKQEAKAAVRKAARRADRKIQQTAKRIHKKLKKR